MKTAIFVCVLIALAAAVPSRPAVTKSTASPITATNAPGNYLLCTVCKAAIGYAELLSATGLGGNITDLLINACNFAPASEYNDCIKLLADSENKIVIPIKNQVAPQKVCEGIKACPISASPLVQVGFQGCSKDCGAVDKCCPDKRYGEMCFAATTHSCVTDDSDGNIYLCGLGGKSCASVCYDPTTYQCNSGVLGPKTA